MGLFDLFPYTSGHTLNLDWIIKTVKKLGDDLQIFKNEVNAKVATIPAEVAAEVTAQVAKITPESINAAPAGFGYGEPLKLLDASTDSDFEILLTAELETLGNKECKQIAFSCSEGLKEGTTYFGTLTKNIAQFAVLNGVAANGVKVSKSLLNGVWNPFEWENPPMHEAVEYKTAERWLGTKSVYTKLINCHAASNGKTKEHGITGSIIGFRATLANIPLPLKSDTHEAYVSVDSTKITIRETGYDNVSPVYVQLWYTKD